MYKASIFGLTAAIWTTFSACFCVAEQVTWQIDSNQSYIRLNIPDQGVVLSQGGEPTPIGVRDHSADPFDWPDSWTDDGGRRSFVQGTIASNYSVGSSLEFLAGQHQASAIHFGQFIPDPNAWDPVNEIFDPSGTTAPAAFAGMIVIYPSTPGSGLAIGDLSIRNVSYDILGTVNLNPGGGGWTTSDDFQVGLLPGSRLDAESIIGSFYNETLGEGQSETNLGSMTIQDLGNNVHKLTIVVDVPVAIAINDLPLNTTISGVIVATATVTPSGATVENASVYHNGYTGVDKIDARTVVAEEGTGAGALTYNSLINSSHGLNGLAFDVQSLAGSVTAADFIVQWSPQGIFDLGSNPPSGWAAVPTAPTVTVTPGSPARVLLTWPNNTIRNRWARVTIKANANTGLTAPGVYYVGHLLGETSGLGGGSSYAVAFADLSPIRSNSGQAATAGNIYDIDKSAQVQFADIAAARAGTGTQLSNITIP